MTFELSPLPYNFEGLEPYIDARTVEIHYTKHHVTYLSNCNKALEKYPLIRWIKTSPGCGRMGTCILLEIPESKGRIPDKLVESGKLECSEKSIRIITISLEDKYDPRHHWFMSS